MELYLIRHGETKWNEEKRLQGQVDIPLNENGIKLARITGEALRNIAFDHLYVSPLSRARETAALVTGGRDIPTTVDERLKEMSFGPWEGQPIASLPPEYRNFAAAPEHFAAPEGAESLECLGQRTADFVYSVLVPASALYKRVLVVGHGACGQSLKLCLNHKGLADFWKPSFPHNCGVSIFEIDRENFRLIEDNRIYYDPALSQAGSLIK